MKKNKITLSVCLTVVLVICIASIWLRFIQPSVLNSNDSVTELSQTRSNLPVKKENSRQSTKRLDLENSVNSENGSAGIDTPNNTQQIEISAQAAEILSGMTLDEKIWQMFFVTPESLTGVSNVIQAGETTQKALELQPVGGVIYFKNNIKTSEQLIEMLSTTQSYSEIPLFLGVDEEGGRVVRVSGNTDMDLPQIPPMLEVGDIGDVEYAQKIGEVVGAYLYSYGFNVDFAPVADIVTNSKNTEIGDRSFSSDPIIASKMVAAFTNGLHNENMASVLKHFPGHGSTQNDSHNGYSESMRTLDEMRDSDFAPFISGIDAGAEFVLVSHMSAINVDSSALPASLSKIIITDILRSELGFEGIVITDSLEMGAITNQYSSGESAVLAIEAGVDMLLIPAQMTLAFSALKDAVMSGRLSEARIDKSVTRIINTKLNMSLFKTQ